MKISPRTHTTVHPGVHAADHATNHAHATEGRERAVIRSAALCAAIAVSTMPIESNAGVRTESNTQSVVFDTTTYSTSNQSLWGSDGPGALNVDWSLSQSQWDSIFGEPPSARIGVGGISKVCIVKCARFGAAAGLEFSAYALPYLSAEVQPGTFDATVSFTPSINQYQFEGLGVDFFQLDTRSGIGDANTFTVNAPSIKLDTGINVDASLDLFAKACIAGCFLDETFNLLREDFKLPLLQVDTLNSSAKVFTPPTNIIEAKPLIQDLLWNPPSNLEEIVTNEALYTDAGVLLGAQVGEGLDNYESRLRDSGNTAQADQLGTVRNLIDDSPVSVTLSNPFSTNAEGQWVGEGQAIATATIGGELLDLKLDVDQVIGSAFGLPNGGSLSLSDVDLGNKFVDASVTLVDLQVGPTVDLKTDLQLAPELMVDLQFTRGLAGELSPAEVIIRGEIGKQTSYRGNWDNIPEIALIAEPGITSDGTFSLSSDPVFATPTFFVESTLSNRTYLDLGAELELTGPSARLDIVDFDSFTFDSGLSLEEDIGSIAQIDIFNRSFRTSGSDWTPGQATTGDALSFVAAGEILFQARSVVDEDIDVAFNAGVRDSRINQVLTIDALIADDIDRVGYDYTEPAYFLTFPKSLSVGDQLAVTDILNGRYGVQPGPLFLFGDDAVEAATRNEYKIDSGQSAQVMTDGSLRLASSTDRLVIEADGTLELAAEHPYGSANGSDGPFGLANFGTVEVHGNIYMGPGGASTTDYLFQNGPGGSVDATTYIGATGQVKLDGRLENRVSGVIDNYGGLELTASSNISKGEIVNRYLADVDIYGKLALEASAGQFVSPSQTTLLDNTGTVTLHKGAQLVAESTGSFNTGIIKNNGQLLLREHSQMTLTSENSLSNVVLNNHFLIDNAGTLTNSGGANRANAEIINGKQGYDWSDYRDATDLVEKLLAERFARVGKVDATFATEPVVSLPPSARASLALQASTAAGGAVPPVPGADPAVPGEVPATLAARYVVANNEARVAANIAAGAKQLFLSEMNAYINDSQAALANLNTPRALISQGDGRYKVNTVEIDTHLSTINDEYNLLRFDSLPGDPANGVRSAEGAYGEALRNVGAKRDAAAALYGQIEDGLQAQADTGIGLIINRGTGILENGGVLTNHAIVLNKNGGQIYNTDNALVHNDGGYVRNNGLLVNQGELINSADAAIDNGMKSVRETLGVLKLAQLVNLEALTNEGELVNNDTLTNYGTLNSGATTAGARILNTGVMTNVGTLNNGGTVTNVQAAELTNHSILVNDGTLVNNGIFNNGQYGIDRQIGVSTFLADAKRFYDGRLRLNRLTDEIRSFDEQIIDSEARKALIDAPSLVPRASGALSSIFNVAIDLLNDAITSEYDRKIAKATAETDALKVARGIRVTLREAAEDSLLTIGSVNRQMLQDENGGAVTGDLFLNLARLSSTNTAHLRNNGTLTNLGIFNNRGKVTNSGDGMLENNGLLMVSEEGVIDNAGTILISRSAANGFEQSGMLASNGRITNSGTIEVSSGVMLNGTFNDGSLLENRGLIVLSASAEQDTTAPSEGEDAQPIQTALFINEGVLENGPFATAGIKIGTEPSEASRNGFGSANTFYNAGTVNNRAFASILNYGELINTGTINNSQFSSFASDGTLQNLGSGQILFNDSAQLDGFVVNDGLIEVADEEILTLTGDISGTGTFAGSVLIRGKAERDNEGNFTASVNPGNSPGMLTFDGDVESQNVDWIMEIWGTERGFSYDGVDINGDFTLGDGFGLTLLSWLDVGSLLDQTFTFFSITGDLFDGAGALVARSSFEFTGFSSDLMRDSWAGTWLYDTAAGWSLNLSFIGNSIDLYSELKSVSIQTRLGNDSSVPLPASWLLFLFGFGAMLIRQRANARVVH